MPRKYLIAVEEICANHDIGVPFITALYQNGLIELTTEQDHTFIDARQLSELEKFIRFYHELDINIEGIETIHYLLKRINTLQDEIQSLRNRLDLYETND